MKYKSYEEYLESTDYYDTDDSNEHDMCIKAVLRQESKQTHDWVTDDGEVYFCSRCNEVLRKNGESDE